MLPEEGTQLEFKRAVLSSGPVVGAQSFIDPLGFCIVQYVCDGHLIVSLDDDDDESEIGLSWYEFFTAKVFLFRFDEDTFLHDLAIARRRIVARV